MFSSNGYVSSKWGFDRGWDVNRNFIRESLPNGSEYLWKTAKAWLTPIARQEAVRLPGDHRAARRLHAAQGVPGQVLGQALRRADQAGALGRAAGPHQGRQAQDQRQRQDVPRGAARRRDHPERRRVRDLHRRPQDDGHLREVGGGRRLRSRRPVLRARQRRPRRHRVPGAGARAADDPRARASSPPGKVVQRRRRGDGPLRDAARPGGHQARPDRRRGPAWCRWRATRWAAARAPR